jgi:hypothetical protein
MFVPFVEPGSGRFARLARHACRRHGVRDGAVRACGIESLLRLQRRRAEVGRCGRDRTGADRRRNQIPGHVALGPGETDLTAQDIGDIGNAVSGTNGLRLVLAVYGSATSAPQDDASRTQFCTFAKNAVATRTARARRRPPTRPFLPAAGTCCTPSVPASTSSALRPRLAATTTRTR